MSYTVMKDRLKEYTPGSKVDRLPDYRFIKTKHYLVRAVQQASLIFRDEDGLNYFLPARERR